MSNACDHPSWNKQPRLFFTEEPATCSQTNGSCNLQYKNQRRNSFLGKNLHTQEKTKTKSKSRRSGRERWAFLIAGGESSVAHENDTGRPSWAAAILDPSRRVLLSAKGSVQTGGSGGSGTKANSLCFPRRSR